MRKRSTGITAIILLTLFAIGCGETFRPIAIPLPQPGGDPNSLRHAIVVAQNPGIITAPPESPDPNCAAGPCRGSASNINVTGDTNIGNVTLGITPVRAGFVSVTLTYTANQGDNTVTRYITNTPSANPVTIPMPTGCNPSFVVSRSTGTAYVACPGIDRVAVMNVNLDSIVTTVPVGSNPTALDESLNGNTVYALNKGDGTVSAFAAIDNVVQATIPVGGAPVASAVSGDAKNLFVVNSAGYLSVIDIATNTIVTTPTGPTIPVGTNPTAIVADANKLRMYVVNTGSNDISVIDANPVSANYLKVITTPTGATIPVGTDPRSITALANGTKAYVANCGSDSVSVIDATSLTVTKAIPTGNCPISLASPTDSSRVIVGVQGAGSGDVAADPPQILTISTQTDSILVTLKPAQQNSQCVINGTTITYCPLQQPVYVTMAP